MVVALLARTQRHFKNVFVGIIFSHVCRIQFQTYSPEQLFVLPNLMLMLLNRSADLALTSFSGASANIGFNN